MSSSKKRKASENAESDRRKKTATEQSVKRQDDLGDNWREKCRRSILNYIAYALKNNILTDVTFIVGSKGAVNYAHRLILAFWSPVFKEMFVGGLAEKGQSITIPDVSSEGFDHLLRFLYSGDITFKDVVDAFKTYVAADKYCVTRLKKECECYLLNHLYSSNVWIFLESSLFLNSQRMTNVCLHYLKCNTEVALERKSFLDISSTTIETFLKLDFMDTSEFYLLLNVVRWAEFKSNQDRSNSFQDIMTPLLRFIQFGALTPTQFIDFLETRKLNDLLPVQDALNILKHLNQPASCPLPDWCCTRTGRCLKIWRSKKMRDLVKTDESVKLLSLGENLMDWSRVLNPSTSSSSSPSTSSSSSSSS